MTAEDYELMPERKLSSMKKELDELRRHAENIDPKTGLPVETITSIENLNTSISSLLGLFKTATEELKLEERDEALLSKKMDPLMKKIDMLLDQNEKIAKAIVAIADMVRDKTEGIEKRTDKLEAEERELEDRPAPKPQGPPAFPPPMRGAGPMPPPPKGMAEPGFPPSGMNEPLPPLGDTGPSAGMPPPPPGADFKAPPGAPGPMPGMEEPKKKGLLGGLFKK